MIGDDRVFLAAIAYVRAYVVSRYRLAWLPFGNNSSFSKGNGRGLYWATSTDSFGLRSGNGGPAGLVP
jgi:hypothetical protein